MACNSRNYPASGCNSNKLERTCIEANRVFDVCKSQFPSENVSLQVTFAETVTPVSVVSVSNAGDGVVGNLLITPISGSRCSRVSYTLTIPLDVVVLDATGQEVTGTASYVVQKDIMMRVPSNDAVTTASVTAEAVVVGVQSTITGTTLTTSLCVTIITKVTARVILSVVGYGYPNICECREYSQDICSGVFSLPLYPDN